MAYPSWDAMTYTAHIVNGKHICIEHILRYYCIKQLMILPKKTHERILELYGFEAWHMTRRLIALWAVPEETMLFLLRHICTSKLTTIGSDNGLSPSRRQAIIWTNAGILSIRTLRTNFSEMLSEIHTFSYKKTHLNMSSAKWRQLSFGLNFLTRLKECYDFTCPHRPEARKI